MADVLAEWFGWTDYWTSVIPITIKFTTDIKNADDHEYKVLEINFKFRIIET